MTDTHGDSPTRPKHTHTAEYRSVHVADCRTALMHDIPEVPEVTLGSLMDGVLPAISPEVLDATYATIERYHLENVGSGDPRWGCLPVNPSASLEKEDVTFKFLENVASAIIASNLGGAELHIELKAAGQINPVGPRHNKSRPDGYFHIIEGSTQGTVRWADIIMPMEFKNEYSTKNQGDDFAKVMWSMHHIMRNDPRRRYVHGLTCEDTKARLWFNNRSDVVVSQEFDINKDWKHLVRIFLSIIMAPLVDLGYDLDVVEVAPPHDENSEPSYDITIRNPDTEQENVYRTIGIISDVGADSAIGRGTRVWKVQRLENGLPVGPIYALKDVWVNEDRDPEHAIVKEIRQQQPDYSQYFLTFIDYGFAPLNPSRPEVLDSTHRTQGRPIDLKPTGKVLRLLVVPIHSSRSQSQKTSSASRHSLGQSGDTPNPKLEGYRDFGYLSRYPRLHYRAVFREIGDPVHELGSFSTVFTAIQGGWEGLHAIHLCTRVHRDVSSGNILFVPGSDAFPERGVIMDLEYSKATNDTKRSHDVKTGTAAFMATEVAASRHHRLESLRRTPPSDISVFIPPPRESLKKGDKNPMRGMQPLPPLRPLPPFRHNPLHDMESIWWLCLWITFYLVPTSIQSSDAQLKNYHEIFRSPVTKEQLLCTPGRFASKTAHLLAYLDFAEAMERWAGLLNNCYSEAYQRYDDSTDPAKSIQIDDEMITGLYKWGQSFLQILKNASDDLPGCVPLSKLHQDVSTTKATGPEVTHRLVMECVLLDPPHTRNPRSKNSAT
ncbi:unnamed protein product [Rhizoctonia solani]|uniref:Fungal-type protein kinase domain-containing protein n=1 Tax=Rhizoctonia solani TaxID=456999 RepID=A0A8H3HHP8_9AGAM|nr:unnamed protein product [Rhizoctonia solani]